MKLRTISQLQDQIDSDLAWRKRELITARFVWQNARLNEKPYALRAGVCLAYAHWEGFIKATATAYLNFIESQGFQYRDLAPALVALAVRPRLAALESAQRIRVHTEVTEFLLSELRDRAELPWEDAVSRLANLDSTVFRDVATMLGIDTAEYLSRSLQIDGVLVKNRHLISHGTRVDVDEGTCEDLHRLVLDLLDRFRTDVENAASAGHHLRAVTSAAPADR